MNNNFIFPGRQDPLLNSDDAIQQLELYKQQLIANKKKMEQLTQSSNAPIANDHNSDWDETERELATLTEDQKLELMSDEQFVECNASIQVLLQELLDKMLKPELLKNEKGKKLIEERLNIVRSLKKKVIKESNKKMDLFKEYTEKYSDMSWDEFLKMKK